MVVAEVVVLEVVKRKMMVIGIVEVVVVTVVVAIVGELVDGKKWQWQHPLVAMKWWFHWHQCLQVKELYLVTCIF